MAIEASPILPDRKNLVERIGEYKQTENYILIKPLEVGTMRPPCDSRAELDKVKHSLDWSLNVKPMFNFRTGTSEEEAAKVDVWYDARIAEIRRAEQQYKQGIAQAEKTGAITASEANRLLVDLSSPFPTNPFERMRRDVEELYRKGKKF